MRLAKCTMVLSMLLVGAAASAPAQYVNLQQWTAGAGANGHWYAITQIAGDFRDAKNSAQALGAYLVSVTSAEENEWVYDNFFSFGTCAPVWCVPSTFYIGLERTTSGGPFAWMSGESLVFTAWNSGEPNDENGVEMVAHLFKKNGQVLWNDIAYNSNPMVAVLEWDQRPADVVPEPATMTLLATGLAGMVAARRNRRQA